MANPANLTITSLSAGSAVAPPSAQTIDTNAAAINVTGGHPMDRLVMRLVNAAVNAIDVTLKAGVNPPALQSRDLVVTVPASSTRIVGAFESGRFTKADGTFDMGFQAASGSPNLTVEILKLPKQI